MIRARSAFGLLAALSSACVAAAGSAGAADPPEDVFARPRVVERAESRFGALFVVDQQGIRHLRSGAVDGVDQSSIRTRDPWQLVMPYLRPVALVVASVASPETVLMIGLGGGAFVHYLRHETPTTRIDAVEIDPVVVDLAQRHFGIEPREGLVVHVADGAEFVQRSSSAGRYDLVFLDAYSGDEIPPALATREFLERVRAGLRPEGHVLANVGNVRRDAFVRRFEAVFTGRCAQLRAWQDDNVILLGGRSRLPDAETVMGAARALDREGRQEGFLFETIARSLRDCSKGKDAPD